MKVTNLKFTSIKDLKKNLHLKMYMPNNTFIQIFSGFIFKNELEKIVHVIKKKSKHIQFIGSTTAGEIIDNNVFEKTIVLSIMEFENTSFTSGYFTHNDDFENGKQLAQKLFKEDTKAMILFIDGLLTNGNDVINGISTINTQIPIAGGMAGDNSNYKQTFVFTNKGVYNKGVVAVSFQSKLLKVYTNYHLNWKEIGNAMTITKAKKNRIYEINNIPVIKLYKKYFGKKISSNLTKYGKLFPLIIKDENGTKICRIILETISQDNSILTTGNVNEGDVVQFSYGNTDSIVSDVRNDIRNYSHHCSEALFIYACNGRKSFLNDKITYELDYLKQISDLSGFFTYGEFYNNANTNLFFTLALTMISFCENISSKPKKIKFNKSKKDFIKNDTTAIIDGLTKMSKATINDLHKDNKKLQSSQIKLKKEVNVDFLSQLYNRRYFNFISQDIINMAKRENQVFSVLMIDIDKFKRVNDDYGHIVGDEVIKVLSSILSKLTRHSDIVARIGGEEFAIILPFTNLDGAYKIAENLRIDVEKNTLIINNLSIRFTVSIGISTIDLQNDKDINDPLKRADEALYQAKEQGRNKSIKYE